MPEPIKFNGRVHDDGTPSAALRANWERSLQRFAGHEVTCDTRDATRSNSANNYYWGFVVEPVRDLFRRFGWDLTKDRTHEWLKREFLGVEVIEVPSGDLQTVETREVVGSTRTDAWTFMEYVHAIQSHEPFVDAGLFIPEPEGELRGRTIHEPGGTKVTFRDPKAEPPEPLSDEPFAEPAGEAAPEGPGPIERSASVQAQLLGELF